MTTSVHSTPLAQLAQSAEAEAARVLTICNACRYCEGYCAVFPAMTRRLEFGANDVHQLANLCHNCGSCYAACQYAPPHEFAVNVPRALAQVRGHTYRAYAWPAAFARAYSHAGLTVVLALVASFTLFLLLASQFSGGLWAKVPGGNFYAIFPHGTLVNLFGAVFLFACAALALGVLRFWRALPVPPPPPPSAKPEPGANAQSNGAMLLDASVEAGLDAARLTYLGGGHGEGCNETDDRFTLARRHLHHFTFYGFMLCLASTSVATIYHYAFGWRAPYPLISLPVVLGMVGGVGLIIGPVGLLWLKARRNPALADPAQAAMDVGFIVLLLLVSASGIALTLLRETAALPLLLAFHLGTVMAFFVTMPYGKFAHGVYRVSALLKNAVEKRRPPALQVGGE
jgi:citrate/tricarballylate utilization protein